MRPVVSLVRTLAPIRSSISSRASLPVNNAIPRSRLSLPQPPSQRSIASSSTVLKKAGSKAKSKPREEVEDADYVDKSLDDALAKMGSKMEKTVEWVRAMVYEGVERGRGRVSPALLDSVKVALPDQGLIALKEVASVTVKSGTLYVEVWDTDATKHVETALHKANLPGMSPQKIDASTLKIPVTRPTGDQRNLILKSLSTTVESAKNQLRLARNDGMKAAGGRGAAGAKEVQELADKWGGEVDGLLGQAKKEFEK